MNNEDAIQILKGQLLATQAATHVLFRTLAYSNPELAKELRRGLADVYDALPSNLSGPALEQFNGEWDQITRLIPSES